MSATYGPALVIGLGFLCAGPALAQNSECLWLGVELNDLTAAGAVSLGRINDLAPRAYFVKREAIQKGCPSTSATCQDKAYLVPGDEVIVTGRKGDFLCASYVNAKGRVTDGWLPRSGITMVQDGPGLQPQDWAGEWRSGPEQTIRIEAPSGQGKLKIAGSATWGASDPGRVARGAFNIGELEGEMEASGADLAFGIGENGTLPFDKADEADCKVQMRRLGPYLIARDNGMCGGMNVSFTGVYRREK